MTAPWGPALDAEVAYRQEQVRTGAGRSRRGWFRRSAPAAGTSPVIAAGGSTITLRRHRSDAGTPAGTTATTRATRPQPTRRAA